LGKYAERLDDQVIWRVRFEGAERLISHGASAMKVLAPGSPAAAIIVTALCVAALSGCTFGTLSTNKCLEYYAQGALDAAAIARGAGPILQESYAYCADGRTRINATIAPLRAHGFEPSEPDNHFEVPNGWCLGAKRDIASSSFDAMRSLETICAIGDASRAYFTGGSFTSSNGQPHYILSTYDREAREELNKRLEQKRR
jgi:hypothetical protein